MAKKPQPLSREEFLQGLANMFLTDGDQPMTRDPAVLKLILEQLGQNGDYACLEERVKRLEDKVAMISAARSAGAPYRGL